MRWTLITCVGLLVCGASVAQAVDSAVLKAERARVAVVEKVAASVVAIFARGGAGGGSGVLISADGYALSNFHVTRGAGDFMKCGLNDGKLYDAVIVGIDPTGDVALIKLLGRTDFPYAELGDSDALQVGHWVLAMGNPFLLATDFRPTVTYGIVSGVHRYQYPAGTFLEYSDCIQVDASINPGNSGGPLFNSAGGLVGINGRGSFEKRGRVNSGAGYAISINQIKNFMDHLRSGRIVDHATLGATVTTQVDGAVVIDGVLEQSEAFRRGMRSGDELVSFGGRPIRSVNEFKNVLGIYPKGWKLPLVYRREAETHDVVVRLRALHRESELVPRKKPQQPRPGRKPPGRPAAQPKNQPPKQYKQMLVKKPGFANFYFNRQEQDRLIGQLTELGDFSNVTGVWRLAGQTSDNVSFAFTLAKSGLGLELGKGVFTQALGDDIELADEPAHSGGLLVAMHHYKQLLTKGLDAFSESYYLGSEPLDGLGERVDVLVTGRGLVETRWYFSKQDQRLVGFDTRLEQDVDECEIRILEQGVSAGRKLPRVMQVSSAGKQFALFRIERFQLKAAE